MVPWLILVYSIGILIFFYFLRRDVAWLLYVNLTLAVLNLAISQVYNSFSWLKDRTIEALKKEESKESDDCFFCNLEYFTTDYERDNPVTRSAGCERWDLYRKTRSPEKYISFQPSEKIIQNSQYNSKILNASQHSVKTPYFRRAPLPHYRQSVIIAPSSL